jgi:hypothetical protein
MSATGEEILSQASNTENGNSVELFVSAESPIEDNTVTEDQEDECEIVEDCWGVPKHQMGSFDPDFSRNDIYMFSAGNTLNENLIFQGNLESCPDYASNANRQEKFSYETLENSSPLPPKIVDEVWKIPQEYSPEPEELPDAFHKSNETQPTETQPAQLTPPKSPASPADAAPSLPSSSPPLMPNTDSSNYFKFFTPMQFTPQVKATTRSINFTPFADKKKDFLKSTLDMDLNLEASTENFLLTHLSQVKEKTCDLLEGKKEHATASVIKNEATEEADFVDEHPETGNDVLMFDIGLIGHPSRFPNSSIIFNEEKVEKEAKYFGDMGSSQETSQESTENSSSRELGEIFNNSSAIEDTGDSDDDEFADCENNNILVDVNEHAPLQPLQIIIDETATDFLGSICDDKSFNVAAISPRESGAAESISQNFFDFTNDMLANDYTLIETHAKSGKRRVSKGEDILEKINEEPVAEEAPWALPKDDATTLDAIDEQPVLFTVDWSHLSKDDEKTKEEECHEAESGEIDGK